MQLDEVTKSMRTLKRSLRIFSLLYARKWISVSLWKWHPSKIISRIADNITHQQEDQTHLGGWLARSPAKTSEKFDSAKQGKSTMKDDLGRPKEAKSMEKLTLKSPTNFSTANPPKNMERDKSTQFLVDEQAGVAQVKNTLWDVRSSSHVPATYHLVGNISPGKHEHMVGAREYLTTWIPLCHLPARVLLALILLPSRNTCD